MMTKDEHERTTQTQTAFDLQQDVYWQTAVRSEHNGSSDRAPGKETGLHNSMITAAIIGSLFFGLLVVVAVSCSCRLYALRLAAQRQEAAGVLSDSPPHFADGAAADFWFREPPPPYAVAVGEHRYPLPAEGVIVYGGGAQTDITGMCGITRTSQRRPRRMRRHRRRPPSPTTTSSTSHDAGSSEEALHPPPQFDSSVVLSVNPVASSRRKVSAESMRSEEGGIRAVSIAMAMDAAVSCDDTRPLIEDDRCAN